MLNLFKPNRQLPSVPKNIQQMTNEMSRDRMIRDFKIAGVVLPIGIVLMGLGVWLTSPTLLSVGGAVVITFIGVNVYQQTFVDPKLQMECFWLWGMQLRFLAKRYCFINHIDNHIKL